MNNQNNVERQLINRAQGCLLGQVAGDSLGGLVEFRGGPDKIKALYPAGVREMRDGGSWGLMAGQVTDDSELALALAHSIIKNGTYDREASRAAAQEWLQSKPFDCGNTTLCGLEGHPIAESESNGSLMRVSPIGIWGALRSDDEVDAAARADASILHPNPVPQACNALYAVGIAHAIRGESAQAVYETIVARTKQANVPESVCEVVAKAATTRPAFWPQAGWVLIAFQNALWQLLHATSVEEAIVDTIAQGGDTDTNAAICGALVGAVFGAEAIPARWRETIRVCRPSETEPRTGKPRPELYWPCEVEELACKLLDAGR